MGRVQSGEREYRGPVRKIIPASQMSG